MTAIATVIQRYIVQLSEDKMPVFASTVSQLMSTLASDDTSAVDVARVILRDATLTGRLLKMANSCYYNPQGQLISTVSRAVMVLGFEQVKALALSLILIDSLDKTASRDILVEEMSLALHAAFQAQALAEYLDQPLPEDVFIAALLYRLGNIVFWAFADEQAAQMQAVLEQNELTEADAEIRVLGFSFNALTKGLCEAWTLGELLDNSLNPASKDRACKLVRAAVRLARQASHGWESDATQQLITALASDFKIDPDALLSLLHQTALKARLITRMSGMSEASQYIPRPVHLADQSADVDTGAELPASEAPAETLQFCQPAEPGLQLKMLQDISAALLEQPSISVILEMVLEGIYRGVGMDRALFSVLTPDRKKMLCKYALGSEQAALAGQFTIDLTQTDSVFARVLEGRAAVLLTADSADSVGVLGQQVTTVLGSPPYLLMPVQVAGKVIGLFIADRNLSGRPINHEDFIAFRQFGQQANMGLTYLKAQR